MLRCCCCLLSAGRLMWWFYRKGPSGFAGASTAEEVTAGIDGRGLVAVITGTYFYFLVSAVS